MSQKARNLPFDEFFPSVTAAATTGTNVYETNENYIVQIAIPGVKADLINCSVEGNVLTCSAESALQTPEKTTTIWESIRGQSEYRAVTVGGRGEQRQGDL